MAASAGLPSARVGVTVPNLNSGATVRPVCPAVCSPVVRSRLCAMPVNVAAVPAMRSLSPSASCSVSVRQRIYCCIGRVIFNVSSAATSSSFPAENRYPGCGVSVPSSFVSTVAVFPVTETPSGVLYANNRYVPGASRLLKVLVSAVTSWLSSPMRSR